MVPSNKTTQNTTICNSRISNVSFKLWPNDPLWPFNPIPTDPIIPWVSVMAHFGKPCNRAKVLSNKATKQYIGYTGNSFKQRNHKSSFNKINEKHTTELPNYNPNLKDNNTDYKIKWEILNSLILNSAADFVTQK